MSAAGLAAVHGRVAGRGYRALDERLLLWVWATLVDGALRAHRLFVGGMDPDEEDAYVAEMGAIAVAAGVREGAAPATKAAFDRFMDDVGRDLDVGDDAEALAPAIVSPPMPMALAGFRALQRLITVGMLPREIREAYGLRWSAAHESAFGASVIAIRAVHWAVPKRCTRVPPDFVLRSRSKRDEQPVNRR